MISDKKLFSVRFVNYDNGHMVIMWFDENKSFLLTIDVEHDLIHSISLFQFFSNLSQVING